MRLVREADRLFLTVTDDGVGMAQESPEKDEGSGFGLNMVRTFASKLKAEWSVENDGEGTIVQLTILNFKLAR